MSKKKILILVDYFIPGFMAGGPIQSIQNFCLLLKDKYDISIITRDTDLGSDVPYENIHSDKWNYNENLKCKIYYCSKKNRDFNSIKKLIIDESFDYLYLNSLYSPVFTIAALRMLFSNQINGKVILAPRGELNPEAKKIKLLKKTLFIIVLKISRVARKLIWQATSQNEANFIKATFGKHVDIRIASNIPKQIQNDWRLLKKKSKEVKFVSISRISRIKNIDFFLKCLIKIEGKVTFDIVGPIEDKLYWSLCEEQIKNLPNLIKVNYLAEINNDQISKLLDQYHFFVSPSKGENFGHSIFEALIVGKPVLISDRTPWRDLINKNLGWDIPLEDKKKWEESIQIAVDMTSNEYEKWSKSSWSFAKIFMKSSVLVQANENVFS